LQNVLGSTRKQTFLHSPVLTVNYNIQMEADTIKTAAKR